MTFACRLAACLSLLAIATMSYSAEPAGGKPADAVAGLDVAPGLEATLFAAEPMILSPSDIDVDHLGRVWVCEVVNYRGRNGTRAAGDRIVILEDTDHDGLADKSTVFYQGRDIDSALGICVLGNRVIVSVAPDVFILTDTDGDGKADKKESLFTKTGQPQHDHSVHAFVFGPDGKFYWNMGNTGKAVFDKDGKPVTDVDGIEVNTSGKPYRDGMAFRMDADGSYFEVLGYNFRNNYELAVDSFGTVWQSDNDDDGNRGVRINYVMEHGNFGYVDELTGAGWKQSRTNLETEVPLQHWHQNDPGVVPNLLLTGAGSPTGICFYEGDLLPPVFRNQVIHCDAGPNVCRAYPATNDGAGYKAEIVNILEGKRDSWFRPSDVCVAPDGSLIVADWYDPGVGGHRMGDVDKGRIFRVAPPGTRYELPKFDFATPEGAVAALQNPNHEARYLAWTSLSKMGPHAEPELTKLFMAGSPHLRARALWLLARLDGRGREFVDRAMHDPDPNLRITALRAARELQLDAPSCLAKLVKDPSPQVRRECALALRHVRTSDAAAQWAELAVQHDGHDRWYLEALGIGADGQWDTFLDAWLAKVGDGWNTSAGRDILWRSRGTKTAQHLAQIIKDPATTREQLPRYFRSLDYVSGPEKDRLVASLVLDPPSGDPARQQYCLTESLVRLDPAKIKQDPQQLSALEKVLDQFRGTEAFVRLVDRFGISSRYGELLAQAAAQPDTQLGVEAIRVVLARQQPKTVRQALAGSDPKLPVGLVQVLGNSGDGRAFGLLVPIVEDDHYADAVRQEAVRSLAKSKRGGLKLAELAEQKKLPTALLPLVAFALNASTESEVKAAAARLFPLPPSKGAKPLPPLSEMLARNGSSARGKIVFDTTGTCAKCHIVAGQGKEVGPNLSEIGGKLSREAMFESILYPSAGISHNYETHAVLLDDGNVVTGIITSETPEAVSIKGIDAIVRTYPRAEIDVIEKQKISLMPADLQKLMTAEELVDVIAYLGTLKPPGGQQRAAK